MREHCRTQHNFDPMPKIVKQNLTTVGKGQFDIRTTATRPSDAAKKFMKLMGEVLTIQELGQNQYVHHLSQDSFGSMDNALNYLMDNYVFMRNTEINGISGHICNNCLSFQFQYIKDIGFDLTAGEKHLCLRFMVNEANSLQNKFVKQQYVHKQAYDSLAILANSIFMGKQHLVVNSRVTPAYVTNLHIPLIKLDSITPTHWAWMPISKEIIALSEIGLKNYIALMGASTYALIFIESGDYSGYHLMYVERGAINQ
jgi:hypothetical protein